MDQRYRVAIIKTLAYFELFDMPLTGFELQRHLYWPHKEQFHRKDVRETLREMDSQGELFTYQGYFYLESDIKERLGLRKVRERRAIAWLGRAKPWLTILAAWPGVETIAICNNLALLHAKEKSDIDLFIITSPGKIWQTRFVLAAFLQIFKKRTTPNSGDAEKFCLSFFVSSDALDLQKIQLEEDIYFAYWLSSLMPIYDPMNKLHDLYKQNSHLVNHVKHIKQEKLCSVWQIDNDSLGFRFLELFTNQASWFPHWLEAKTKSWQQMHFSTEIKQALKQDSTNVIANDKMLKFHTNDRRRQFLERWKKRCDALLK